MSERIPDAELEVLACVQRLDGATARAIREAIAGFRPLSHSSVMTLLGRLEERGLVRREPSPEGGRELVFQATASRDEALEPILRRLVNRVFEGDAVGLMASLYGGRRPDAEELDRLAALLEELRAGGPGADGPEGADDRQGADE